MQDGSKAAALRRRAAVKNRTDTRGRTIDLGCIEVLLHDGERREDPPKSTAGS